MLKTIEDKLKCSEAKKALTVYFDDVLSDVERSTLDCHLLACPLCRVYLSELQEARNLVRAVRREPIPAALLSSIRDALAVQLLPFGNGPNFRLIDDRRNWLSVWLMPSLAGSLASLGFGFLFIWAILAGAPNSDAFRNAANLERIGPASAISGRRLSGPDILDVSPAEYASNRLAVSRYSPSLNPQGALVAMTRSLFSGETRDDELVVVADVFSNGLARVTEVVEPSADSPSIMRIRNALESDPEFAPFVPASLDRRSDITRVVLRIQNVNVPTRVPRAKRRPRI
ncbi:MAG: hypothetical protein C4325_05605 [Blastocatellia bacterium]